jgi:predicted DsbA family dithiol-disulfide isomerase
MAEASLASLKAMRDVTVEWKAFELRPNGKFPGTPEVEARYRAAIKERHAQMTDYARQNFGLEMGESPMGVNSRPAMLGAYYARAKGQEDEYHRLCLIAHWQENKRVDDMDILVSIAVAAGLDGDEFRQAVESHQYQAEFDEDLNFGREVGIEGVPAFIFGNHYLVSGARPPDVLVEVVDKCIEEGLVE